MAGEMSVGSPGTPGFPAYERETVDRFFADAWAERMRLLTKIADARRRIAHATAALMATADSEDARIRTVLDAQRALRDEQRANARAIAAVHADAETQAELLIRNARDLASAAATTTSHDGGHDEHEPVRHMPSPRS